jgi:hypothetical protein
MRELFSTRNSTKKTRQEKEIKRRKKVVLNEHLVVAWCHVWDAPPAHRGLIHSAVRPNTAVLDRTYTKIIAEAFNPNDER